MYILLRLIRILFIALALFFVYRLLFKGSEAYKRKKGRFSGKRTQINAIEEMKKDPVCGTYIPESQGIMYQKDKSTYFFCSEECKNKFLELEEKNR